jgi:Peptidase family M28/ADP-ribosylglycohydrolase
VMTAVYCFLLGQSFDDVIVRALRIGGDTDTIAAMAGALAGARFGFEAIPDLWRDVEGHDELMGLADSFHALLPRQGYLCDRPTKRLEDMTMSSRRSMSEAEGLEDRLRSVVEQLCAGSCQPRNTGQLGATAAADYLTSQLEAIGLNPAGEEGFIQTIPSIGGRNVLGALPGRSERWVVLAAHYDACGSVCPGADDNAAGVSVVLELARQLLATLVEHSVLIAFFDAEEPPYFRAPEMGSQWFVDHPTIPLDSIDMMVCLDLVGHALGRSMLPDSIRNSVFVLGAERSAGTARLFDDLPARANIVPRRIDNLIPAMSDYHAFMNASIPFLFYSCGRSEHYHAPTDTADRLDYAKMGGLTDHLLDLMTALGNRYDRPTHLPNGADDAATLETISQLLNELEPYARDVSGLDALLDPMRARLIRNGLLDDLDRRVVTGVLLMIEQSLSLS